MTNEAEIKQWPPLKKALWNVVTAAELNGDVYVNAYTLTDKLHDAALAAARPSPDAGLVERKPFGLERTGLKDRTSNIPEPIQDRDLVSQIIEPGIFAHDGSGSMVEFMGVTRRNSALGKADAILALLSSRAVAGEPTRWLLAKYDDETNNVGESIFDSYDLAFRASADSEFDTIITPLYTHPPPSGRDPAVRQNFTIPDGFEPVRDAEGRATGEVRRIEGRDPAMIEAVKSAFVAGAMAVHKQWLEDEAGEFEGPPRGDPEFGEAASDYAASLLTEDG